MARHSDQNSDLMIHFLGRIFQLSREVDEDKLDDHTSSSDEVFGRLKEEAKLKIGIQRRKSNYILYDRLRNRRIGTNEIEQIAKKITTTRSTDRNNYIRNPWHKREVVRILELRMKTVQMEIQKMEKLLCSLYRPRP